MDLLLFLFLATAASGVWAAYDREAAWSKFGLIVCAVLLYYLAEALSRSKPERGIQGTILLGWGVAGYFLLLYHLGEPTEGLGPAHTLNAAWVAIREAVLPASLAARMKPPDVDQVAAVVVIVAPLAAIWAWRSLRRDAISCVSGFGRLWKRDASGGAAEKRDTTEGGPEKKDARYCVSTIVTVGALAVLLGVAYLTGEAGPLLILLVMIALALWVWLSAWLARNSAAPEASLANTQAIFLGGGLALAAGVAWVLFSANPDRWVGQLNGFLGAGQTSGRVEIWGNSLHLLPDFFLTGGGLASFPGLYSQYILALPYEYLENSHNLLLEVAVEQGFLGFLALAGIWGISFARLAAARMPGRLELWRVGVLGSGLAALLLALTENVLYNSLDILLLFWLPGLASGLVLAAQKLVGPASAVAHPAGRTSWALFPRLRIFRREIPRRTASFRIWAITGLALLVMLPFYRPAMAAVYANLGAVAMARAELADFPLERWQDGRDVLHIEPYKAWFEQVLRLDPDNRTAHYRLGLIAYVRRDFSMAVSYLEPAMYGEVMNTDKPISQHRGIRKTLGYSYTWMGDFERAVPLLASIPEAARELIVYNDWWADRGQEELAEKARQMLVLLRQQQAGSGSE